MTVAIELPPDEVADARWRARYFSLELAGEAPMRLHSRSNSFGAAPDFTSEFSSYLDQSIYEARHAKRDRGQLDLQDDPRRRVTKAFRKLRRKAPREFDVLHRMCVIDQVGRNLRPDDSDGLQRDFEASMRRVVLRDTEGNRISEENVLILVVSGIRQLVLWAG
jgi:hypothetical protein